MHVTVRDAGRLDQANPTLMLCRAVRCLDIMACFPSSLMHASDELP